MPCLDGELYPLVDHHAHTIDDLEESFDIGDATSSPLRDSLLTEPVSPLVVTGESDVPDGSAGDLTAPPSLHSPVPSSSDPRPASPPPWRDATIVFVGRPPSSTFMMLSSRVPPLRHQLRFPSPTMSLIIAFLTLTVLF
ncbi:unnamed protein product [Linum trigynum]|uniref:Uncharacterized protein n=1 Tax=Linum trigynum TaxID=586398 RepID=A0AAV2ESY3_9ROSI